MANHCKAYIASYITGSLNNNGDQCYNSCPPVCASDQISCPSGNDALGCPMADTCVSGGKLSQNKKEILRLASAVTPSDEKRAGIFKKQRMMWKF